MTSVDASTTGRPAVEDETSAASMRQRKAGQTSFAENSSPPPSLNDRVNAFRRRDSMRTASSRDGSRPSLRSTDSFFVPRATDEQETGEEHELNWLNSTPLVLAILPAVGGLVFKRGSVFLTDFALLVLAALYLNWCLVTPWVWYRSAQSVKVARVPAEDAAIGENVLEDIVGRPESSGRPTRAGSDIKGNESSPIKSPETPETNAAINELRLHEVTALALCFLGPLLGSYVLHIVRSQLSTIGDELVGNMHLTLFVLSAEIRPLRHAIKMAQARTIYLQRVVRDDPRTAESQTNQLSVRELSQQLNELEASFADKLTNNTLSPPANPDNSEAVKKVQTSMQSQIDALTRAVRRYEKRATAQTMQTEARLQDLDTRLKEAVSLAAAAATYSQKPGILMLVLDWAKAAIVTPVKGILNVVLYPLRVAKLMVINIALRVGLVRMDSQNRSNSKRSSQGKPGKLKK